ncbi:MAG: ribonuclease Z [Gemmatimonadetes bacterium]|nr:ribonuclease Z [Gemmatimonadota bacterium]
MLSLTFLGTSAARPTVERNVSSIALVREGETLLFECGEGTQRQMMRYGVSFALSEIFITHFHADHFLGVIGLIRTLGLQGRTDPLHLYGPPGGKRILSRAVELGVERAPFSIELHELDAGDKLRRKDYDLEVIPADHGKGAVAFALREHARLGRFDPDKAKAMGIPEGPLWGRIHKGEAVEVEAPELGGSAGRRVVSPSELVGPPRPGRLVVFSGDTRPSPAIVEAATGADLLVHEATFGDEEKERAKETGHSTAVDAAQVALAARARQLVITHLSARYSASGDVLLKEAQAVFPATVVARDGMTIEVPYRDLTPVPSP